MPNDPLDLWPESIEVAPLTPAAILKIQAQRLKDRTRGLLYAEVTPTREVAAPEREYEGYEAPQRREQIVHRFEIVAPGWNNYRHQLFRCHHDPEFVYPVWFAPGDPPEDAGDWSKASSQQEFTEQLRRLFGSKDTTAVIQSLLALSAEATATAGAPAA